MFPYPRPDEGEQRKVPELIGWLRDYAAEAIDPVRALLTAAVSPAGEVGRLEVAIR